jgi:phosphoribosylcarboxyaminoimidazole (NCAIR) mutase
VNRRSAIVIAALTLAVLCSALRDSSAITLDWDQVPWTNGALNAALDIDPDRAGNDVTIAITGSTNRFTSGLVAPNPATPAITRAFDGGKAIGQNSLELAVDLGNMNHAVTFTLTFSATNYAAGVTNVSFNLFDIDKQATTNSNFEDQIRSIYATLTNGTQIAATITNLGSSVVLAGTGLAQTLTGIANAVDTGPESGAGNATISFLSDNIRSITFVYGSGSGAQADPTYQHIGIGDMEYSPVPEINPAWTALLSCLAAVGLVLRHRAIHRK